MNYWRPFQQLVIHVMLGRALELKGDYDKRNFRTLAKFLEVPFLLLINYYANLRNQNDFLHKARVFTRTADSNVSKNISHFGAD